MGLPRHVLSGFRRFMSRGFLMNFSHFLLRDSTATEVSGRQPMFSSSPIAMDASAAVNVPGVSSQVDPGWMAGAIGEPQAFPLSGPFPRPAAGSTAISPSTSRKPGHAGSTASGNVCRSSSSPPGNISTVVDSQMPHLALQVLARLHTAFRLKSPIPQFEAPHRTAPCCRLPLSPQTCAGHKPAPHVAGRESEDGQVVECHLQAQVLWSVCPQLLCLDVYGILLPVAN